MFGLGGEREPEDLALAHEKEVLMDFKREELRKSRPTRIKASFKRFDKGAERIGTSFGQFGNVGMKPQRVFSQEQDALSQMFGGGDHMWGLGDESETQVSIHNDLNPSRRGDFGTAEMFGF